MLPSVAQAPSGDAILGRRVRERRDELKMSQGGLGSLMRPPRSQSFVSGIENAQRFTDASTLRELARVLDTTVADLLGEPPLPGRAGDLWALLSPTQRDKFNATFGLLLETWGQPEEEEGPA